MPRNSKVPSPFARRVVLDQTKENRYYHKLFLHEVECEY